MLALAANREPAEAIQVYRGLRMFLNEEARTEPSAETTALYRSLQSPGQLRQPPSAPTPRERPAEPPATEPPTNLPFPLTGLIGRERELLQAAEGLTGSRLVTLSGMGGMGKTRLAIETALRQRAAFPDGVWFVDLASVAEKDLVARAVAAVLAVRKEAGQPLAVSLIAALRDRQMLLVIDNCEHLIEPSAQLVRSLVSACPRLHVLATSRQALGLTGEIVLRLEPLPLPPGSVDAQPAPLDATQAPDPSPAVRLFAERAAAAQPAFAVTAQNMAAVSAICHRLDGIPLALELAAARIRSLSAEQIASRLEDRFRLLTSGSRAAPPRQQTLRALVDWSFDQLGLPSRLLFARLSVFAGGWTLEAAEEVCGDITGSRQQAAGNRQMQSGAPRPRKPTA